jgi:tetratricopeptide (TPR) repeat protein
LDRAALFNSINQKLATNDIEGAIDLAEAALALGETHPTLLNLCAHRLETQGDFEGSLNLLDQALQIDPDDVTILNAIGHSWLKQAAPQNALRAFAAALHRDPNFAPSHHGAGLALWALGDLEESRKAQARAAELDPNYPDPRGALALLALHEKKPAEAREYALAALRLDPAEPAAFMTLATLDNEAGQHQTVADMLAPAIGQPNVAPLQRASLYRLYGDALDALGRFDEAFSAYQDGNSIQRRMFAPQHSGEGAESSIDLCRRIEREFESIGPYPAAEASRGPEVNHVFLVGFPRSGTTLLEQILASHPDVVALEEKPTLNDDITDFFLAQDSLDPLMTLSPEETQRRVDAYWSRIAGYGLDVAGKTFVDKQPSLTLYLPLVARLFPKAKIIVARRDPRDVVLSCFRRGFNMNRTIYEFADLERLSTYYSAVMRLAEIYAEKLPLTFHVHAHEAMIADFDRSIASLCAAIGVEFDDNMRNFVETAKRRDIRTPSARQVVKGLDTAGVGYWRNYASHLAPATPILQPWISAFGYE